MAQPRLLLIDDEPALAQFLATAAEDCGFQPVITSRDDEFRAQVLAERPDMVALDLGMPGMDGVELLRFLSEQDFKKPVLIVSGFDRRRSATRSCASRPSGASWPALLASRRLSQNSPKS